MMTTTDTSRARFDALVQIVAEQQLAGQQPDPTWLIEIARTATEHPEWVTPPTVVVPPVPPPVPAAPLVPASAPPPRAAVPFKAGERKPIILSEQMQPTIADVLKTWGVRFNVFQAGGKLFEVQVDKSKELKFLITEPNAPRLLQVGAVRARVLASQECDFQHEHLTKDGTRSVESCMPPEWLGSAIVTSSSFPDIPPITGIAQAPTLRSDGALIWERGYDESTGIYLASDLRVNVPENPTQDDAKNAMLKLLDIISDFDFVNPAGRSVWVAGLLSIVARHTFNGPVPITIIDASKRGSGKTTLVDVACIIATGSKASRMFYTDDDAEMDKRITSLALAGEQVVLIDNITGELSSPPLDAALTSDSYRGRVLGKSEMTAAMPMKIVWFATGNGMTIGADTARRTVIARLEPEVDRPEDRTGPRPGQPWKYPRLMNYVTENRVELLSCALTIVKAYIQAGRPRLDITPMGSYEEWSATIRAAIVWAGAADPCLTVEQAREADVRDFAVRHMIECWPVPEATDPQKPTESMTAAALIKLAEMTDPGTAKDDWKNALLEWLPARGSAPLPTARDLGYALRAIKGSVIGNFKIEQGDVSNKGISWRRVRVSADVIPITTELNKQFQALTDK